VPTVFAKLPGAVTRPDAEVRHPGGGVRLDYEGEIGLVIGRRCYRVGPQEALEHVAGLVIVNDLTDRALAHPDTLLLAKSYERFAPMGPWLTTLDEAPEVGELVIRTWVNGELRQDGSAIDMIHDFGAILALVSSAIALEPGDVIITGSPAGSGAGFSPPRWLQPGDVVRIEVTGLGAIEQRIVA
jgi:2-keto-4-pentenoate hydratase/2-oxohepta-3-ene-1,7-dioic acid hydratase in catechol pathway